MHKIDLIINALDVNDKYIPLCNYFKEHLSDFSEYMNNESVRFHYQVFERRIEEFIEAAKKYSDADIHTALAMFMSNNVKKKLLFDELIRAYTCIIHAVHAGYMQLEYMWFLRMNDIIYE